MAARMGFTGIGGRSRAAPCENQQKKGTETMIHFNKETFKQTLSEGKLMMVDFWAEWCGPCQMLGPVIESLAERYEGRVVVGKVNTDEEPELAIGYQVSGIPTVIFFKDGKEIDRKVGVMPPDAFVQVLEDNL